MLRRYGLRNWVKEQICRVYDAADYAMTHPYTSLRHEAHEATIEFIKRVCPRAIAVRTPKQLMSFALDRAPKEGALAEFGVFQGASLNYMARRAPSQQVHGFDSFEGLPESWVNFDVGAFTTKGKLPKVPANVRLWVGWFDDTIPQWREEFNEPLALLHVDCDLRSSTETVMDGVRDLIQPGTVIVFDDYFNFPGWGNDGHAVFEAYKTREGWDVEYLAYAYKELAVRIR